jgi:hypothetical protein
MNLITISQGSDCTGTLTLKQPDWTPIDLTGYSARGQVRDMSGALVASMVCTISASVVSWAISNAETAALIPAASPSYVWGIELTAPSGQILPEIQGTAQVTVEVVK